MVAIEPNPESLRSLITTMEGNGIDDRVTTLPLAIHPHCDRVDLNPLPWSSPRPNGARTNSGMVGVTPADGYGQIPAQRLDQALAPFESIAVLKIDAEDLSVEILESGLPTVERHRPVVAIEAAAPEACARVEALLLPLGYATARRVCWTPTWLWTPGPVPESLS